MISIDRPVFPSGKDLSDHFPIRSTVNGLSVISYNLQFLPAFLTHKNDMAACVLEMARYFREADADVCCVQELFDSHANDALVQAMHEHGYIATELMGSGRISSVFNGGIRFFVKASYADTIEQQHHIYKNKIDYLVGADAMINKGVSHLMLTKSGVRYHVFNTHLQSFYEGREYYSEITLAQCVELKQFIEAENIQDGDCIIICGDFNIGQSQYKKMTRLMGAKYQFLDFTREEGSPLYTFSSENSFNSGLHQNENLDRMLVSSADRVTEQEQSLVQCYGDIQNKIARFVSDRATIFSLWRLSAMDADKLSAYNRRFESLIRHADALKAENIHPTENALWCREAASVCPKPMPPSRLKRMLLPAAICIVASIVFVFYGGMLALGFFTLGLLASGVLKPGMEYQYPEPIAGGSSREMLGQFLSNADFSYVPDLRVSSENSAQIQRQNNIFFPHLPVVEGLGNGMAQSVNALSVR